MLICCEKGKWALHSLAPPFLIGMKSTSIWEENGSDFIHPTDKKKRTGAFRQEGLNYNEEESRAKIEKVLLGKNPYIYILGAGFIQSFQITLIQR